MRIGIKFFRSVIANGFIAAVVVTIFLLSLGGGVVSVSTEADPIYKGASRNKVCLMVNVYWGTEYVPEMLAIFEEYDVKTTFFVGGSWVNANEEVFSQIVNAGHELGNHGYNHRNHSDITALANKQEILANHRLVSKICGVEMKFFAPPSGDFDAITLEIARDLGYTTIMWSKDTIDWRDHDKDLIRTRATKNIAGGDLVLMHPTEQTVAALPGIISDIKSKNLTVAPVSEVLAANE